ncbi:EAL domain-containing protein [Thermomonas sp.]|uniref:sensor domain-containing protein n=1 Tax=Thermomonas sp. TaxID=1971895 RepID=UPI002C1F3DB2|nr:EAL domain-containing protein [Thermomonas sp.]HRO64386.1 EAL domain-containing protein [Thermomonas sp.]
MSERNPAAPRKPTSRKPSPRPPPDPAVLSDQLTKTAANAELPARLRTLLRKAAAALAESGAKPAAAAERRHRAFLDAIPDPTLIISRTGVILDANAAALATYGRKRHELVGHPVRRLNPGLPDNFLDPVLEMIDRGETHITQTINVHSNGTRFPVEVHSARLTSADGPVILAIARDLSARTDAGTRYTSLADAIDRAITLHDRDGLVLYLNPAAARMYALDSHALGRPLRDSDDWTVVDPQGQVLAPAAYPLARALRDGKDVNATIGLYQHSSQRLTWLSVTIVLQYDPGSTRPDRALMLGSEITDLQRDKALFERVQELAQIGGWQWNRRSDALHLTSESMRILRQRRPPAAMEALLACLDAEDGKRLRKTLKAIRGDTGFDLELRGRTQRAAPFWIRMIGEPDPLDPGHNRFTGTLQDITESKRAEDALRAQAQTDALTGLLNRDAILESIRDGLDADDGPDLAVLYIDLDRFKIVNDALGHDAGDRLLVEVAQRLRKAVGKHGAIARFGGDEFLVTCRIADDPQRPERLARRIQTAFEPPFLLGKTEFSVSSSIGLSRAPTDGTTPERLIQSADFAMYVSKRSHHRGFQNFSPALEHAQQERLQIETRLRRALDNGEFHLAYQPQVDLHTGRILFAEALLRWNSPDLGTVAPERFIDLAENTGDVIRIGHWALLEACTRMRRWQEQSLPIQRVAVNVSYRQFVGEDLVASVRRMLKDTGIPGHALELEITERVLVEDTRDTALVFDGLRSLGVRLTIDDFGEGYSALNYLRRLPLHGLKLSQGFVHGIPDNRSDVAICQAVTGIARSLGLDIIAEGIETEAQRDFLLRLGVTVGQGYLFQPGLPPGELAKRLLAQTG